MALTAPLVVDLQTGLLRTDLAREGFWLGLARGAWRVVTAGRGETMDMLLDASPAELANLPMNAGMVEAMRRTRAAGGRVILVTDASEALAQHFARALDFVDEAVGDAPPGPERKAWLAARIGGEGYTDADLDPSLRAAEERPSGAGGVAPVLKALRPHQWVKNLLVFLPIIAAHKFDSATVLLSLIAFAAFSLIASSVYVLNDLLDLSADRAHPRKRFRPMASGAVPLGTAAAMGIGCLAAGFAIAIAAGPYFVAVLCGYTILTTAYSLHLKREPVLDICVLATLYTMRIVAGAAATGITPSVWLLAFAIFIFLSLAALKRQAELVDNLQAGREKPAGRGYRVGDLPIIQMMGVTAGYVAVLVLALYLNAPTVVSLYQTPEFLWIVCAVLLYWISRAVMIAHRGEMHDDPIVFALRDRISHVCAAVVLAAVAAATWA
jgi:4-hydroxybenzoate polyprenyltransferase